MDFVTNSSSSSFVVISKPKVDVQNVWLPTEFGNYNLRHVKKKSYKDFLFDKLWFRPEIYPYYQFDSSEKNMQKSIALFEKLAKEVKFDKFTLNRYLHELVKEKIFRFNPEYEGYNVQFASPAYFDVAKTLFYYSDILATDPFEISRDDATYHDNMETATTSIDEFLINTYDAFMVLLERST
jgi:hypothetical protein